MMLLLIYLTPFSTVSIVDFKQVKVAKKRVFSFGNYSILKRY